MEMKYYGNYNIFLNKAISAHKHLCNCCVSVMMMGFVLKDQVRSFRKGSPSPLCFLNSSHFAWGSAAKPGS